MEPKVAILISMGYRVYRICKQNWYSSVLQVLLSVIWVCWLQKGLKLVYTEKDKYVTPFRPLRKGPICRKFIHSSAQMFGSRPGSNYSKSNVI
jgi:hypothetical protein